MASAALVFAGKSVATPIIKEIVTTAFSYLGGFFSEKSMQELRDKLNRGMPKIQAVLDVVSPDQYKDKSQALDDWFWQLRDAVEEAEDAIDELEYYQLEEKANDRKIGDLGSSFDQMKHKVAKTVKHVSVLDKVAHQFTHHDTIKRLKKAMESLEKAAADVKDILDATEFLNGPASGNNGFMNNCRQTGSMLTASKFVGREVEKERIIEWLTKTTSIEEPEIVPSTGHIPILSIVGHGGMGKTTLVQSILENKDFKDFKTIWVTVSTTFDATSLISKILESITRTTPSSKYLEPLQKELEMELLSVKYLLILDDVWEEKKRNELEKLFAPLRRGKSGSKIILTTRMTSVAELAANVMGVKIDRLTLEGLKEDQSLELFNHHVFSGMNCQEYEQLKLIGEHIARKLGGCPLVTKVASAALQDNMTSGYWNTFLHKRLEHFIGTKDDIMGVLRLSYYNLSSELQSLFRYCSLFPQDKVFEKKELVQLWIGSGLILPVRSDSLTLVDIGEHYLACLTRKSFFELKYRVNYRTKANEEYYVMHDLIHDLATNASSGECARITDPDMFEKEKDTVRHLLIDGMGSFSVGAIKKIYRFKNLRTIIVDGDNYDCGKDIVSAVERIVESSKSLRLLHSNLVHTSQFGNKLGNLKHLRYILLDETSLEGISGVVKLYHLMLLKSGMSLLRKTKEVRYVGYLDRLRYVNIGSDDFPVSRLTCLQELNHYRVQGSIGNKISAISVLRDLRALGLYCLENVKDQEEASSAKLSEKQYLNSLFLGWTECRDNDAGAENSELVLEHLQPPDNIQKLQISGYTGLKFPCWIENPSLKSLVSLRLEKCINWEHLPFVAELVFLKNLELVGLRKLQQIGRSSDMFGTISLELLLPPSLQRLEVKECSELRELPILPPCLNSLDIIKCPILKELPILPPSLVTLRVEHAGLTTLPMVGKIFSESTETKASRLKDINISNCQHLTSLAGSLLEHKLCLGSLERLRIQGCKYLVFASIPFDELSGLRKLHINDCPKLTIKRSAGDKLLPSSLTELSLGPCFYLDLPLQSLQGLAELSELSLHYCPGLVSLPSADVFKSLAYLRSLVLWYCGDLSSLGGLRGSLKYLSIRSCNKLMETPDATAGEEGNLLQIDTLKIDLPCLLLVEPLKSICHTRFLVIFDGLEMKAIPQQWLLQNRLSLQSVQIQEAKSLESLPSSMRDLSCLEYLELQKVEQLKSLPDLPPGLRRLRLSGCNSYLKKLKEYGNTERHKISHIQEMKIGGSYFIMGKECSEETYDRLSGLDNIELASRWAEQQKDYKRVLKRMLTGCSSNISKGLSPFK